ncbi:AI-2E family transporter [Bacillus atrophaeus]|uniref:AI-2E family transporter n=1 Tax=Bacillus atrophaeus TaxID=1452 RepID=UPI00227EC65F|nr:AI-2E family transporter [Bacillus atrophaeus]MCY8960116.1 AI-2E family transporter [Bacillus atrophaeus]MCY8965363.1 AI-2E family transporter [Bacillus atrophaeus]MCY9439211.1 AI-2E family transporter [Bacillus atrophaeus]MEC0650132.1 AI-2E family transporter [Bacillus atrophaeus]
MTALIKFFQHPGVRRFLVFVVLAGVLYLFKSMINLILLTFIFTFLMNRLENVVRHFLNRFFRVSQRGIITLLYIALAVGLTVGGFVFYPVVAAQIEQLIKQIKYIAYHPNSIPFFDEVSNVFGDINISSYVKEAFNVLYTYLADISTFGLQIVMALILSMFFLFEKKRLSEFMEKFKTSKLAVFYNEFTFFGGKFARTFGKVLEAQFIIALVNCILTFIALWIMHFPQLFGLSIMVFFLGLIPVAGVVISLVPLSIIAYSTGGGMYVLYIVLVIMAIHAIETYFLNPKLMSAKTELPIFFTFTVLIFSEHFLGIWGLIIGIPIFVFLLDILDVTNKDNEPG